MADGLRFTQHEKPSFEISMERTANSEFLVSSGLGVKGHHPGIRSLSRKGCFEEFEIWEAGKKRVREGNTDISVCSTFI